MVKRYLLMAAALLIGLGGVIGFKLYKQAELRDFHARLGLPPAHLNAARVEAEQWQPRLAAIGSLRARRGIEIRSEVDGVVRELHMRSGQAVETGELLLQIDDAVERATLRSARVNLDKARRDFERDRTLFGRNLIAEDAFDLSRSAYEDAQALVEQTEAIIRKKTIRAPFEGRVGIHRLAEGHYLSRGDEIVTLQALGTLYLEFNVPENELARLKVGQTVEFSVPSYPERRFSGTVSTINVRVQATTRNVLVQAEVDNPEGLLLPGMFADISLVLEQGEPVVTVPWEAVAFSPWGETVHLLETDEEGVWRSRSVRVQSGMVQDGRVAVSGLQPGQLVARDSQNRLMDGVPVAIENLDALDLAAERD